MTGRALFLVIFLLYSSLEALDTGRTLVPNDTTYYKYNLEKSDVALIYPKENIDLAKETARVEKPLHKRYQQIFHWTLDETLYVGLMSDNNEIANAFSSQWPNNRQINYIGGASEVDYFSSSSWLEMLLYHESAHNYQVNVKGSSISCTLHALFGNGTLFVPSYFTVPGSGANSFMLEGNAVLNESLHANGGRLYNGRLKAMSIVQAKAGMLTAPYMYNALFQFPYKGDIYYQIGAHYNLYMARKYGLKKLNSYFLHKTEDWWWPFFTNSAMKKSVGIDFEDSLKAFSDRYKKLAENFVVAKGEKIASSQFYTQLSSNDDEIFFITNESGYNSPELVVIEKKDQKLHTTQGSWIAAKVIKKNHTYYTQASHHSCVTKITQGLYDKNAFIKKGSESKIIQAYLHDGRALYFNVKESFERPALYVGKKFYAYVNSSVIVDKEDNIYYFINKKGTKKRTLYKNREALYTYEDFYGIVSDVDSKGAIYFVANSELGSTLYRYKEGQVSRASRADNIVEARLLSDDEVLLSAIGESEYYYVKSHLEHIEQEPYETKLSIEEAVFATGSEDNSSILVDTSHSYKPLLNMHYSGSDMSLGTSVTGAIVGGLNTTFSDPLTQNTLQLFISADEYNSTIAGVSYTNTQNILSYLISAYKVIQKSPIIKSREYGLSASLSLPLYKQGYYNVAVALTYFEDYDTLLREPLTASFSYSRQEKYGVSMYNNFQSSLSLYGVKEKSDGIYGLSYTFMHELGKEFYLKLQTKYSQSNPNISQKRANQESRGVKISPFIFQQDMDMSTVIMPSVKSDIYIKSIGYGELGLLKVFNFSSYFFTFPFSLQRESFSLKYRYYGVQTFIKDRVHEKVNEYSAGVRFDTVFLNILSPFTVSFDFYYNDNKNFSKDTKKILFKLGTTF